MCVQLFPDVMASMLTSPDPHLLLLALSSIWHLVDTNNTPASSPSSPSPSFDFFLAQSMLHDAFYDTLVSVSVHAHDEQIRSTASCIVEFADRVREEE
jgi:hypothetical protein